MGTIDQDLKQDPPCHSRACEIQNCLQKHNYQQKKCEHLVDALYECCNAFYKKEGPEAQNVGCPKYDLLQLKMKQRAQGIS